ncbi:MAG: nucleotide sugar dehydrogenase [Pseudomonadota bacterium]|nr:nucleotide sugar dehydrogenase [Pseudomonadota bacterium]
MKEKKIAVLGLGYVGLPLAVGLSSSYRIIGFDISLKRISQLRKGIDDTLEIRKEKLKKCLKKDLVLTNNYRDLEDCNIFIATVPTPITKKNKPDFKPLKNVCRIISKILKKNDIVVFESTVFPGATEDICAPVLEKNKDAFKSGKDFFLGYSPERVNPGDKVHTIDKIDKVISGQNKIVERVLTEIYSKLTKGKVFLAKSIKVAEASKVIENAQRDINIAFINEVAKICNKMNISVYDVLDASATKWNFLSFKPGLVGGHCIGVDPYYLAYKSKKININPKVILSGRKTNDEMPIFIAKRIHKIIKKKAKLLFLGITFKEDVPDLRNSKSFDVLNFLKKQNHLVSLHDPYVFDKKYKILNFDNIRSKEFDGVILAVPHQFYLKKIKKIWSFLKPNGVLIDIKGRLKKEKFKNYWSL